MHAGAGESQRGNILRLGVAATPTEADRQELIRCRREILKPPQHRLHMKSESMARRRKILGSMSRLPLLGWVIIGRGGDIRKQRNELLVCAAGILLNAGATSVVLDHVDHHEQMRDRRVLASGFGADTVAYQHAPFAAAADPLVSVADVIAWTAGRKEMRSLLPSWVTEVPL